MPLSKPRDSSIADFRPEQITTYGPGDNSVGTYQTPNLVGNPVPARRRLRRVLPE